jgi:glycosyltransferase involved in cell wall biosynthesis
LAGDRRQGQELLMRGLSPDLSAELAVPRNAEGSRRSGGLAGVNVCGYLRTESGVGSAIRGYLRALRYLDVPLALKDVSVVSGNRAEDRAIATFDEDHPYDINLICGDIDLHFSIVTHLGADFFRNRSNIGIWAWELPRFPAQWYDRFVYYDEIWVGTSFIANALAPISPLPIVRIPPVLTAEMEGSRERGRRRLRVAPDVLVYLFLFDVNSYLERKNPLAVVEAFTRAFAPSDPVHLVIKSVNAASDTEGFTVLRARAQGYPVSFSDGYWPAEDMRDLMAACDVYVSLHRSEGTGLTITDAMALGKPVIATAWSGNMDFMNVSNSFPVRYDLVRVKKPVGPYREGETWAQPSVEHAAELMRLVFDNPEEARSRGEAGRQEIEANYSEQGIARLIERRLAVLRSRHRFAALKRELEAGWPDLDSLLTEYQDIIAWVPSNYLRYQQLLARLREVIRTTLPPGATVIVISRGDGELLKLEGRTAWHFPQREDGIYAGYNPADSAAAIAHLEALRAKGGQYLLLPSTTLWWLEHYAEFRQHLQSHYRVVVDVKDTCLAFALCDSDTGHPRAAYETALCAPPIRKEGMADA